MSYYVKIHPQAGGSIGKALKCVKDLKYYLLILGKYQFNNALSIVSFMNV